MRRSLGLAVSTWYELNLPANSCTPAPTRNCSMGFHAKYTPGMAEEFVAELSADIQAKLADQASRAFTALKLRGYARIDFRLDPHGQPWCLEANTLPGMTPTSLIPQAAAAAGVLFPDLCERIVQLAIQ